MNESIRNIINTKFKKSLLVGTLLVSLVGSSLLNQNVDAKKNTRPKITMKGKLKKKKLTLIKGQTLKLNFKAKDKEDGNLTKKVKVKIQKPKGGKIKKSKRKIKFLKVGKYKLTFTVKDSKNKKRKVKRLVKVVPKKVNKKNMPENSIMPTETPDIIKVPIYNNYPSIEPIKTEEPTINPINTNDPVIDPINTINPTSTPVPTVEPTSTPVPTVEPTSTPVPTVEPTSTPKPTVEPTSTPVPTVEPTSTPVQTQAPTSTPKPTVGPTSTPSATYDPFYDALHQKYDVELKTINNKNYYITKEKITEEKFMDNSSENSLTIKFANDYENIVFDKTSKYLRTDEYMKFIGSISAKDYKGRSATSNIIISTNSLYTEEGKLENETDKKYPIYVYVEDYEGNACTKVFYVSAHEYTEEEKNKYHNAMYGEFNYLIQNNPIVFGYKKSLIDMMDEFSDTKEKVLK